MKKLLRHHLGHDYLVIVGVLSLAVLSAVRLLMFQPSDPYRPILDAAESAVAHRAAAVPPRVEIDPSLERELSSNTARTVQELSDELAALLADGQFAVLRDRLLHEAAAAVAQNDKRLLGHVLALLGQVALEEQDLDSAEVYLMESLDVYQNLSDPVGTAQVYMQLGRTHLKARELARTAGDAYDKLLVARWQLSEQQYGPAERNLRQVVEQSLAVNRFGAAASALHSLVRLYTESRDVFRAEQAAMEAAKLYAASGQLELARATVEELRRGGVDDWRLFDIEREIEAGYTEFKRSVEQIERARDYRQLYNHYRSRVDEQRAWNLRLLASKSLRNVSKRAMYHRQPDALALLYVSNDDISQAKSYFDLAKRTFDSEGLDALSSQTEKLKSQIF